MYTDKNLKDDIKTVTRIMQQTAPFFYVLPFSVVSDVEWAKLSTQESPTAAASPKGFFFASSFMGNLPENKRLGLLLHEVFHPALGHLSNRWVDTELTKESFFFWRNYAMDAVIESAIYRLSASFSPDKDDPSKPNKDVSLRAVSQQWKDEDCLKYADMSWREVYDHMKQQAKADGRISYSSAPGDHGNFGEESHDSGSDKNEQQWKAASDESAQIVERMRSQGQSTATTIQVTAVEPEIPWIQLMRDHIQQIPAKVTKSWSRVKRRPFAIRNELVPHETGTINALETVSFWVDTSGSMSNDLNKCASEISSLLWQLNCKKLILVEYDTKVCSFREIDIEMNCPEQIITYLHGGGGTSIRSAIDELISEEKLPSAEYPMIVLTDGGDDYRVADLMRDYNITWITYGSNITSDVGRVIHAN